jgi:hypothetical protein
MLTQLIRAIRRWWSPPRPADPTLDPVLLNAMSAIARQLRADLLDALDQMEAAAPNPEIRRRCAEARTGVEQAYAAYLKDHGIDATGRQVGGRPGTEPKP